MELLPIDVIVEIKSYLDELESALFGFTCTTLYNQRNTKYKINGHTIECLINNDYNLDITFNILKYLVKSGYHINVKPIFDISSIAFIRYLERRGLFKYFNNISNEIVQYHNKEIVRIFMDAGYDLHDAIWNNLGNMSESVFKMFVCNDKIKDNEFYKLYKKLAQYENVDLIRYLIDSECGCDFKTMMKLYKKSEFMRNYIDKHTKITFVK